LSGKIKRFCFEGSLVFSRGTLGIRRLLGDAWGFFSFLPFEEK
jgi:hypothetical protein